MTTTCQTEGCTNAVTKSDYKLCLDCWKKQRGNKPPSKPSGNEELISSSKIGEHFGVKATRVNAILSELGWVAQGQKGWNATALGESLQAAQKKHHPSGRPFVMWPASILHNKILCEEIANYLGKDVSGNAASPTQTNKAVDDFRNKFPANFRATDGHWVRSKAEMLIDNFLYTSGIVHAYERKLPVEEDIYTDFYLLKGKVYIEYWGLENDPKYQERKRKKLEVYKKHKFNLIELGDDEVKNLDDHLPRLLLPFGIEVD